MSPGVQSLGILARSDDGGLGVQTLEYARHLDPEAVLIVALDKPRGEDHPERFDGLAPWVRRVRYPPHEGEFPVWDEFAERVGAILTAECFYLDDFPATCAMRGTRLIMHANPELWEWGSTPGFEVWSPTPWEMHRIPTQGHLPMPIDRERCSPRGDGPVRRLLHPSAPAMMDRNGTLLVRAALELVRTSFELLVSGPEAPQEPTTMGNVTIRGAPRVDDYWRAYDEADALLLPRRYGGLCLPMQEAASCGLPVIATSVPPQVEWLHPELAVKPNAAQDVRMKGGMFPAWSVDPAALAAAIDALVGGDIEDPAGHSERFAAARDWRSSEPLYREALGL